jgi:hypothetical protein
MRVENEERSIEIVTSQVGCGERLEMGEIGGPRVMVVVYSGNVSSSFW